MVERIQMWDTTHSYVGQWLIELKQSRVWDMIYSFSGSGASTCMKTQRQIWDMIHFDVGPDSLNEDGFDYETRPILDLNVCVCVCRSVCVCVCECWLSTHRRTPGPTSDPRKNESCPTLKWVMCHVKMSHVPRKNESCPMSEWASSYVLTLRYDSISDHDSKSESQVTTHIW